MKTKYFYLAALASLTLASCSSDDFIAEAPPVEVENTDQAPILFSSFGKGMTRGDFVGAEAADLLNNKFVVTGFKGDKNQSKNTATPGSIVFDNYLVEYKANTAGTTASNSNNWEYVGKGPIAHAKTNGITSQTIKYWDYSQTQYDFIAWAVGKIDDSTPITVVYDDTDISSGHKVRVSAIAPNGKTNGAWPANITEGTGENAKTYVRPSYTFEGKAEDLSHCYISDIVTVKKGDSGNEAGTYGEVEGYGKPVTLKFRQLGTKVRIALYETVPGYSVKNVKFYSAATGDLLDETDGTNGATNATKNKSAKIFTTTQNEIFTEGIYTVYFPTVDSPSNADNNQAHIKFSPKLDSSNDPVAQSTTVDWGEVNYTGRQEAEKLTTNSYLGRTSNTASFAGDPDDNYYVFYLPNETGTNLNLRVDYTLESIDGSGEETLVRGATAQVPSIYTTWKPGYAYTYIFKISDKTNGHTGVYNPDDPYNTSLNSDPTGLYPITFDAVVVNAEEGNNTQETITLVSTPSITTYQNGSNVVNKDEYTYLEPEGKITGEIYVTVNDAEPTYAAVVPTPTSGTSVAGLYTKVGNVFTPCAADAKSDGSSTYYSMTATPKLEDGALAKLDGKVKLYIVADGTTEAQVIDALQYQEDDGTVAATGTNPATITGRNTVLLTETALTTTNSVTYGVDGNTITVGTDQAAKFTPANEKKTFAFVYTKEASTTTTPMYEPRAFSGTGTKYRYKIENVSAAGVVQKGVVYIKPVTGGLAIKSVFLGQGTGNLYTSDGTNYTAVNTETTPYAVPSTAYYYTIDNGANYTLAKNINYADFNATGDNQLYVKSGYTYKAKTETEPVDGTAYYFRIGAGTTESPYVYTYCVILPELTTTDWKTVDTDNYEQVGVSETEIEGMTYFDMYTKNNGVYYSKVIKVTTK